MSKTALLVGEIAAAVVLTVVTYGAGSIAVAELGASLGTASALFSIGVAIGITGVFGLLQPLLNPQDTSVPGSQSNAQESAAFRRVIYGVMETGGVLTFDEMPAGNAPFQDEGPPYGIGNWRHQIYTVSGAPITAFGRKGIMVVVIDDIPTELEFRSPYWVPIDPNNPWCGTSKFGDGNPVYNYTHIGFEFDIGVPTGSVFPGLSNACPDWQAGICLQTGSAKVHVAMRYDCQADGTQVGNQGGVYIEELDTLVPIYNNGRVPTFRFPLIGKPLLDTRLPPGDGGGGVGGGGSPVVVDIVAVWIPELDEVIYPLQVIIDGPYSPELVDELEGAEITFAGVTHATWLNGQTLLIDGVTDAHLEGFPAGTVSLTMATVPAGAPQPYPQTADTGTGTAAPHGSGGPDGWAPGATYSYFNYIIDPNGNVEVQLNGPGTGFESGTEEPVWGLPGTELTDNDCVWSNYGPIQPGGWPGPSELINATSAQYVFTDPNGNLQLCTLHDFRTGATQPQWRQLPGLQSADGGYPFAWICATLSAATYGIATNPSNPALIIYDWLTNTEYGEGADPSTIDINSINAAANLCEEQVVVYIGSNGLPVMENLYNCDGVFDQGATRGDVLKSMLSSCAGTVIPPGDMWHLFAGAYNPSSFTLTDADLRAPIKADFRISRRDICNGVKGTFIPNFLPTNTTEAQPVAWRWTDFPPYQGNGLQGHPNYIAEDGGQIIWKDVRFGFTTSIWMAQRLAKITLQLLRFQVTLHIQCKLTAFPIQAGDTITFIHKRWAALASPPPTVYFVTQSTLVAESTNGAMAWGMDLVLRETDPSVYEFTAPSSSTNQGEYSQYGSLGTY